MCTWLVYKTHTGAQTDTCTHAYGELNKSSSCTTTKYSFNLKETDTDTWRVQSSWRTFSLSQSNLNRWVQSIFHYWIINLHEVQRKSHGLSLMCYIVCLYLRWQIFYFYLVSHLWDILLFKGLLVCNVKPNALTEQFSWLFKVFFLTMNPCHAIFGPGNCSKAIMDCLLTVFMLYFASLCMPCGHANLLHW